jgi:Tfp pilus assembly protein PilX
MKPRRAQAGLTLVISLIMLVVLTLLVVSAIRFSNINLRLAGNAQTQAEAAAAAQVAIEKVVASATAGTNLSAMSQATSTVSTGGASYAVTVSKPVCNMTQDIDPKTLDPSNTADQKCFGLTDPDKLVTSDTKLTSAPTACKNQLWDIGATVGDATSGAAVSMLQGVTLRVGAEVSCP